MICVFYLSTGSKVELSDFEGKRQKAGAQFWAWANMLGLTSLNFSLLGSILKFKPIFMDWG